MRNGNGGGDGMKQRQSPRERLLARRARHNPELKRAADVVTDTRWDEGDPYAGGRGPRGSDAVLVATLLICDRLDRIGEQLEAIASK